MSERTKEGSESTELQEELIETTRALSMAVRELDVLTTALAWSTQQLPKYPLSHEPAAWCSKDVLAYADARALMQEVSDESLSRREPVPFTRLDLWLVEASIE